MSSIAFIFAPLTIFFLVVAPLWLILHYRSKRTLGEGISDDERARLLELSQRAASMQARLDVLESILDDSVPSWRRTL